MGNRKPIAIFLDIDGVLNNGSTTERIKTLPAYIGIDPSNVKQLNVFLSVLEKTGDYIMVLSSTWRKAFNLDDMNQMLREAGYTGKPITHTTTQDDSIPREEQILEWVEDHKEEISDFIAIDDHDMRHELGDKQILANGIHGFTLSDILGFDKI